MPNVLNVTTTVTYDDGSQPNQSTKHLTTKIPFPKPLGIFPPRKGILIPQQTLDDSVIGLLGRSTLEELEDGSVGEISQDLFQNSGSYGPAVVVGRAQGVFVASTSSELEEDTTNISQMVAITANLFDHKVDVTGDGLRLFGVVHTKKERGGDSHIAVIGGSGKYEGANGFAVIKAVHLGPNYFALIKEYTTTNFLLFNLYLS
ncbi:Dirigent protein 9 [Linum perenne]